MPDMKIAIGFGWETGMDSAIIFPGLQVFLNDIANKIGLIGSVGFGHASISLHSPHLNGRIVVPITSMALLSEERNIAHFIKLRTNFIRLRRKPRACPWMNAQDASMLRRDVAPAKADNHGIAAGARPLHPPQ